MCFKALSSSPCSPSSTPSKKKKKKEYKQNLFSQPLKFVLKSICRPAQLKPIILATWEMEIRKIVV
jgi:hypothetical protein